MIFLLDKVDRQVFKKIEYLQTFIVYNFIYHRLWVIKEGRTVESYRELFLEVEGILIEQRRVGVKCFSLSL